MGDHNRFLIDPDGIEDDIINLDVELSRRIARVLRLQPGDRITLLDGLGNELDAEIATLSKNGSTAKILGSTPCLNEASLRMTLAMAIPKGDKLELIVQKCTELGISRMIVMNAHRSVARIDDDNRSRRIERLKKVAAEAVEQCGRCIVPDIAGPLSMDEVKIEIGNCDAAFVACEDERGRSLKDALDGKLDLKSVIMLIGPEGGFTLDELGIMLAAGAEPVSLGKRILRCETAAIAASAIVMSELDKDE